MTANQIAYWTMQEQKRSNLADETERNRANVAKEVETNRSNLANEVERNRSNLANEALTGFANQTARNRQVTDTVRSGFQNARDLSGIFKDLQGTNTSNLMGLIKLLEGIL